METANLRKVEQDLLVCILRDFQEGRRAGRLPPLRRLIRLDIPRWSGQSQPSAATRMAYSRGLKALDEAKLLIRFSSHDSERTAFVRLTRLGKQLARELLSDG